MNTYDARLASNINIHQKPPSLGREMSKMSLQFPFGPKSKTTSQSHDKEHRSHMERTATGQRDDSLSVKWHDYVGQIHNEPTKIYDSKYIIIIKKRTFYLLALEAAIKTLLLESWLLKGTVSICPDFPGGTILHNNQMALLDGRKFYFTEEW